MTELMMIIIRVTITKFVAINREYVIFETDGALRIFIFPFLVNVTSYIYETKQKKSNVESIWCEKLLKTYFNLLKFEI